MSKELRQLLSNLAKVQSEANALMAKDGVSADELNAKLAEVKALQAKIDMQKTLDSGKEFDESGVELDASTAKQVKEKKQGTENAYHGAFMNAIRRKASNQDVELLNSLNPGTDADGGLIVPKDIQTQINQYKRTLSSLEPLINMVPVGMPSGSRVYEKIATMLPFANITDLSADLSDMGSPQFENISYAVKDYGGLLPVPNDLLNDTDQNLTAYLTQWIGRKSIITRNSLILAIITALTPTVIADWKGIKKALNITLDPIFSASASIVTNQDGYQYLDTLTDGQNRPLLQPDAKNPGGNVLFGKPITVISNGQLATTGTTTKKAPFIIGNLAEAITMFERQGTLIASTNVGGTAFQKNQTQLRAIEREDIKSIDTSAVVYGQIDVTSIV